MAIVKSFNHDVDILEDKAVKFLKAKFKLLGYAIYIRLLEEIYSGTTGYYIEKNEEFDLFFCDDNKIEFDFYNKVVETAIEKDLFNETLFKEHNVLTSERIQKEFVSVVGDTKRIKKDFLLLEKKKETKKKFNPRKDDYTKLYLEIYNMYPKKEGKRQGMVNFYKRLKDNTEEELIFSIRKYIKVQKKKGTQTKYIDKISNFFGTKATFEDYLPKEGERIKKSKEVNINNTEVGRYYEKVSKKKNIQAINSDY